MKSDIVTVKPRRVFITSDKRKFDNDEEDAARNHERALQFGKVLKKRGLDADTIESLRRQILPVFDELALTFYDKNVGTPGLGMRGDF